MTLSPVLPVGKAKAAALHWIECRAAAFLACRSYDLDGLESYCICGSAAAMCEKAMPFRQVEPLPGYARAVIWFGENGFYPCPYRLENWATLRA